MDNSDHIERKIKEGFEGANHKAPEGLWSAINDGLEIKTSIIDEKVKSSFEHNDQRAPNSIWIKIDKQLTIDKGWRKVYAYLRLQTYYKWTKRAAALLVFLFLVTAGILDYLTKKESIKVSQKDNGFSKPEGQQIPFKNHNKSIKTVSTEKNIVSNKSQAFETKLSNTEYLRSKNHIPKGATASKLNFDKSMLGDKSTIGTYTIPLKISSSNGVSENDLISLELNTDGFQDKKSLKDELSTSKQGDKILSVSVNSTKTNILKDSIDNASLRGDSLSILEMLDLLGIEENQQMNKITFEFGLTSAINTTAIINNKTSNSFDEESLTSFIPSIGSTIGLQFVVHLDNRHSLASSITHTGVNQSYNQFDNGRLNEEVINTSFVRMEPLYQFKYNRFGNNNRAINFKVGPYFGLVTRSRYTINKLPTSVAYNNYDFGFTLQFGHNFGFNKFVIDYGLNLDKGLTNLNKGTYEVPASFDKTTSLALGVYLSLRYKF